jgi:hypothetical protein
MERYLRILLTCAISPLPCFATHRTSAGQGLTRLEASPETSTGLGVPGDHILPSPRYGTGISWFSLIVGLVWCGAARHHLDDRERQRARPPAGSILPALVICGQVAAYDLWKPASSSLGHSNTRGLIKAQDASAQQDRAERASRIRSGTLLAERGA